MPSTPVLRARPAALHPPALRADHALFLDFDGTLVDLAARPELVRPDPQLVEMLQHGQQRLGGAVALLTGRRIETLDGFLGGLHIAAAGLHGSQLRLAPDAPIVSQAPPIALDETVRAEIEAVAGLWLEDKGSAVAIHFRAAPDAGPEARALLERAVASAKGLEIVAGKFVYEARAAGYDKGAALQKFMQRKPFKGRTPVFVGDDVTDEDAIAAVQQLGGFGIKVGPGESAAEYRLVDPQAVLIWLQATSERDGRSAKA